jgi:GrpB-like predicted nucleotidyltransferase (UPF0157 family)
MIGLRRGTVTLVPHSEEWHQLFKEEADRIVDAAGDRSLRVEHIGSTAICGISAKPILDILVGTTEFETELPFQKDLEAIGYEYKGENGIPERHFFGKGNPRTMHLNVVRFGGSFWLSHLAFRDFLLINQDAAFEYERLKVHLATQFPNDREAYTTGKETFIKKIIARAMKTEL